MCNFTYFIKLKGVVTHFQDILKKFDPKVILGFF